MVYKMQNRPQAEMTPQQAPSELLQTQTLPRVWHYIHTTSTITPFLQPNVRRPNSHRAESGDMGVAFIFNFVFVFGMKITSNSTILRDLDP